MKKLSLLLGLVLIVALEGCAPTKISPETQTGGGATVAVEATATPEQTPDIAAMVMAKEPAILFNSYVSPDGQWRTDVMVYDCVDIGMADQFGYEQLKLVNVASGEERVVADQLRSCGGLGAFGLEGLFWSSNSHYFYYTEAREGGPDGCSQAWLRPISRIDTVSFKAERLGGGPTSPDGKKLATWQGRDLVVWDLNGSELNRAAALFESFPATIAWAPDGQSLVYLQIASPCLAGETQLVRVDLANFKPEVLLESAKPSFGKVSWEVQDELTLVDENGKLWKYNLVEKQLSQ